MRRQRSRCATERWPANRKDTPMQMLGLMAVGVVAGVAAGMFGIGGGLIIVPALVLLYKMTQHSAVGTSLGAILLPVGALGAWVYWKNGDLNVRYSLLIAAGLLVGAFLGAKLVEPVSDLTLRRLFGGFLLLISIKMILGK
ncbi:MAG TPA: sulfite exporter TauE/SafE family protein [Thermoanaerobaculia bacterium]|nr:sulfite exporter TauE/SafE family protein [Thermoanaerobaculia bacterium]